MPMGAIRAHAASPTRERCPVAVAPARSVFHLHGVLFDLGEARLLGLDAARGVGSPTNAPKA